MFDFGFLWLIMVELWLSMVDYVWLWLTVADHLLLWLTVVDYYSLSLTCMTMDHYV